MVRGQRYINSEHVDEILYLFRKRIAKYPDVFPDNICILDDLFSQRLKALYEVRDKYPLTPELLEYCSGKRPVRGRDWSNVRLFYIPWNCDGKHWILLVADVKEWFVYTYDSIPEILSHNKLKKVMQPFLEYFPIVLKKSGKFSRCNSFFGTHMILVQPPTNWVPTNKQTGDCGVYMLKTLEMHIAGLCNDDAQDRLNDMSILDVQKFYAIQIYANNADP